MNDTSLFSKNLAASECQTVVSAWMATDNAGKLLESFILVEHGSQWLNATTQCYFELTPSKRWSASGLIEFLVAGSGWDKIDPTLVLR